MYTVRYRYCKALILILCADTIGNKKEDKVSKITAALNQIPHIPSVYNIRFA
jgi:hypothetical protein